MPVDILRLDSQNKRVYLDVDAGAESIRTVKQIGSLIKQELQLSPHIDQDAVFTWSGDEEFITDNRTGVVLIMQDGWQLWTENQGSKHRFRITQGLVLDSASGDPLGSPTNIVWSLAEQSVSSISGLGTVEGKIDIIDTNVDSLVTDLATVDGNVDLINALIGNDQEWVSPGLLKIYNAGGKVGGVTVAEFETRTSAGVQTFVLADVKQYIRTK
jgi:hypothetical protein